MEWMNLKGRWRVQEFDKEIEQFIKMHSLWTNGSRILVACSGGVDSMVLLHFLGTLRAHFNVHIGAVHVDHMLRGKESAEDGQFVQSLCTRLAIPFYGGQVPVPEILKRAGGNVQTICREGRYAFFDDVMQRNGYDTLVTGHHAEDQLETILMQITKGVSPLGMPTHRKLKHGLLARPFLPLRKESLYAYAKKHQVPFREDPSNQEDAYMRNRFRHHIVPSILEENPAVAKSIVPLTDELQEDERFLQQLAKEQIETHIIFTKDGYPTMHVHAFRRMPTALQRRAIPLLLNYLYDKENNAISYKSDLIRQLMEHLHSDYGNISIDLPDGFQFIRSYDQFYFQLKQDIQRKKIPLPKGEKTDWDEQTWLYWEDVTKVKNDVLLNAKEVAFFNLSKLSLPLSVRHRKEGDRILLKGMTNAKRLSRLFIDEKVSRSLRDRLPVVVTHSDEVCAIPKLRYGSNFTKEQTVESKYIFVVGTH